MAAPCRKRQRPGRQALEVFPCDIPDNTEVESQQSALLAISLMKTLPVENLEVTTHTKCNCKKLKLIQEPLTYPICVGRKLLTIKAGKMTTRKSIGVAHAT